MKKFVLVALLLFFGIKYGVGYLMSDKFQDYGDQTKAPWTCQVNNFLGHFYMVLSDYYRAQELFSKAIQRCPDTTMSEVAEFETAECLYKSNRYRDAIHAYRDFVEKHKGTRRAKIAERNLQIISAS
jgi:outer membrane protein assembly factor BamD (BamD/ComL family)